GAGYDEAVAFGTGEAHLDPHPGADLFIQCDGDLIVEGVVQMRQTSVHEHMGDLHAVLAAGADGRPFQETGLLRGGHLPSQPSPWDILAGTFSPRRRATAPPGRCVPR